jgi:hypothetical protein
MGNKFTFRTYVWLSSGVGKGWQRNQFVEVPIVLVSTSLSIHLRCLSPQSTDTAQRKSNLQAILANGSYLSITQYVYLQGYLITHDSSICHIAAYRYFNAILTQRDWSFSRRWLWRMPSSGILKPSSYLTGDILRLHYRVQTVKAM